MSTLILALAACFGVAPSSIAAPVHLTPTYTYDIQHHPAESTKTTNELDPPATCDAVTPYNAETRPSGGALVRSGESIPLAETTYGDPIMLAPFAPAIRMTSGHTESTDGALSSFRRWQVAANTAKGASRGLGDAALSCANRFTPGTPVLMASGKEEPIADVKVGEKVVATDPETGRTEAKPVVALIRHSGKHTMVGLTLSDGSKISTTDHHPFWDATTRTFTDAITLQVGDRVLSDHGRTLTIPGEHVYERELAAYNLQIDGIHTYYAGATPILVHNSCVSSADVVQNPQALEGLAPNQVDDLARNAGYDILPGKAGAVNPATRYYKPGTNWSVGFRVLPDGVAGQTGVKGGAYLRFFGGPSAGLRIPLGSP